MLKRYFTLVLFPVAVGYGLWGLATTTVASWYALVLGLALGAGLGSLRQEYELMQRATAYAHLQTQVSDPAELQDVFQAVLRRGQHHAIAIPVWGFVRRSVALHCVLFGVAFGIWAVPPAVLVQGPLWLAQLGALAAAAGFAQLSLVCLIRRPRAVS